MPYTPTSASRAWLAYFAIGATVVAWSALWFAFSLNDFPKNDATQYSIVGWAAAGGAVLAIGLRKRLRYETSQNLGIPAVLPAAAAAKLQVVDPFASIRPTRTTPPLFWPGKSPVEKNRSLARDTNVWCSS